MIYIILILWVISLTDIRYIFSKAQFLQHLAFLKIDSETSYYARLEWFAKSKLKYEVMSEHPTIDRLRVSDYINSNSLRVMTFCYNFASIKNRIRFLFGTEIQKRKLISEYGNTASI